MSNLKRGFCERNLKPTFALLIVLAASTIAWPLAARTHERLKERRQAGTSVQDPGAVPGGTDPAMAGPAGGDMQLVAQPATMGQVDFGTPVANQPIGRAPRSRHRFRTVSQLIRPCVVSILTRSQGRPDRVPRAGKKTAFAHAGSGVVICSTGLVLTNAHVVARALDLTVRVYDTGQRDFPATVLGVDATIDLALLKIARPPPLPEARLGDSSSLQVGDWVLAFGSPFGLDQTVTQGILSNRWNPLVVQGVSYGEMLQTDAPTNRGSSGGPLVNMRAEVVGINTAIYGPNGVFNGTGFAVPADRVKGFLARFSNIFQRPNR